MNKKPVILTGLRANNELHIGNYFGALLPLIDQIRKNKDKYQINLFIPDLHSITTPIEYKKLQSQIIQNLKIFVASGLPLDEPYVHIYRQSYIPAHSELTWLLDCFTGFGEMNRMTQFKDKSRQIEYENSEIYNKVAGPDLRDNEVTEKLKKEATSIIKDRVSVGLFNYPVLMAADILLYGAQYVPVGDDQSQHLEYTRNIAERINSKFGDVLVVPKSVADQHKFFARDQGLRIKDLTNPEKKMSKSTDSDKGVIFLQDNPDEARKKIMSATTDSMNQVKYDLTAQPGVSNLIEIYGLIKAKTAKEAEADFSGQAQYGAFKQTVAETVSTFLIDFQEKLSSVNEDKIIQKLEMSEKEMNLQANKTLQRVQKAVGLR